MAEVKKGKKQALQKLCKLVDALGEVGIADENDTTTSANLNRLIKVVKNFVGDIDVAPATDDDTTTGADLNRLIAAVKGVLPDIEVNPASDTSTTTGANLNSLFAAIIKSVATPICADIFN